MSQETLTEQEKIDTTRVRISGIKDDVNLIKASMLEIHIALLGSPLTKDGGLVARIIENESRIDKLTIRVSEIENREDKQNFYIAMIWGVGVAIILAGLGAIVSHFLK